MTSFVARTCLVLALVSASTPSLAADFGVSRVLDLSPERIASFKRTMREFGAHLTVEEAQAAGLDLTFEDVYDSPFVDPLAGGMEEAGAPHAASLAVAGRDLVFEEQFLIAGREGDFEDAAKKWLSRRVKGSDAARSERGSGFAPKFGWSDGPVIGVRKGALSATLGEWGWQVRWSHSLENHPGWVARVSAGVDDGEERIAFTIGRSLLRASR